MKLWRIFQTVNDDYDSYDSAVVAAETEDAARKTHPSSYPDADWPTKGDWSWCKLEDVQCVEIGEAKPDIVAGVIVASFNAG